MQKDERRDGRVKTGKGEQRGLGVEVIRSK